MCISLSVFFKMDYSIAPLDMFNRKKGYMYMFMVFSWVKCYCTYVPGIIESKNSEEYTTTYPGNFPAFQQSLNFIVNVY